METVNDCIFCNIVNKTQPAYIVYEDELCISFLDSHPQTYGHLQLVPKSHFKWIYDVPNSEIIFASAMKILRAIIPALGASHATIATYGHQIKHAHIWLVPQYRHHVELKEFGSRDEALYDPSALAKLLKLAIEKNINN